MSSVERRGEDGGVILGDDKGDKLKRSSTSLSPLSSIASRMAFSRLKVWFAIAMAWASHIWARPREWVYQRMCFTLHHGLLEKWWSKKDQKL